MIKRSFIPLAILAFTAGARAEPATSTSSTGIVPIQSHYTSRIMNFLRDWPSPYLREHDPGAIWQRAITTPGQPNYVGIVKHFIVQAPMKRVIELTERFEDYPRIWSDITRITVLERGEDRALVEWVRPPPSIFAPEIQYKMLYTWDKRVPGRAVYRHQLVSANAVHYQDSLIVIEALGPEQTRLAILNFFQPDAGAFADLVARLIWSTSMRNSYMDDVAFRARCEHPDWDVKRLRSEATRELGRHPVTPIKYLDGFSLD